MRFWKDTSGRYLDPGAVRALLAFGRTPVIDGFTARNGRTYRGHIEINREEWKLKVRSAGWNEESALDIPEYEVNTAPLGTCPLDCELNVVETSTEYACESRLKPENGGSQSQPDGAADAPLAVEEKSKPCGFVFPRTVCKREITRDEAVYYLQNGRTELLNDFTSRFGRPFAATLVLKENGRHGFEFQPRAGSAGSTKKKTRSRKASAKSPKKAKKKTAKKKPKKRAAKKASGAKKAGVRKKPVAQRSASAESSARRASGSD